MTPELRFALRLADIADSIAGELWSAGGVRSTSKADGSPVTEADVAVERALCAQVAQSHPADGFIGEEFGEIAGASTRRWIVDGIDGTRFFAAGERTWGTLIALECDGVVVLGVSSSPAQRKRWWATRDGGAFTTSTDDASGAQRLRVSSNSALLSDRVATLPAHDRMPPGEQHVIEKLLGAPASDHAWSHQNQVAAGQLDACVWFGGDLWDHAAPSILVEEAGGMFTDHHGSHRLDTRTAVYSNGIVHAEILAELTH